MSINFPSDAPALRRKKGGGFLFLLIFAGIAFMVFRGMNSSRPPATESSPPAERDSYQNADYPEARLPPSKKDAGDWAMEDGPTRKNPKRNESPQVDEVKNGDWEMKDVATKQDEKSSPKIGDDWSFDTTFDKAKKSAPNKTKKGDWSLEEIDN
jgi:hypothetical protein